MTVTNVSFSEINYDVAVELMDDEIREELAALGYESEQEFFAAYEIAHAEKYGEEWLLSQFNPCY